MSLDSVLSSMRGEQSPQMSVENTVFLQNQPAGAPPRNDATNSAPQPRSILNSWVHSGVGLLGFGESNTRNEIEGYLSEGLTAAPLFMGGRRGIALSAVMSSLNEAKKGETGWHLAADLTLGAAKGAGTKLAFDHLGAKKDWNFALKGVTMGATARGIGVGGSRLTWFDQNDNFHPASGLIDTASSMFHPYALATDIASFGIAHGTISGLSGVSERFAARLESSPLLQNTITAGTFGFTSGSLGELQRQMNDPNEKFDPLKILLRGGASAGTMTLAGAGGAYFSAPGQYVVRPQTEPFDPVSKLSNRFNQFRSWLGGGSGSGEPVVVETAAGNRGAGSEPTLPTGRADLTNPAGKVEPAATPIETGDLTSLVLTVDPNVTSRSDAGTELTGPELRLDTLTSRIDIGTPDVAGAELRVEPTVARLALGPADATTPLITVEPGPFNPLTAERTVVRIQQPSSEVNPVVTNPGELNLVRFTPKNYDVWDAEGGFHFFRDADRGIDRAFTSIEHKLRFELHEDGVWRTRRTKTNDPLLEPTPAQKAILDRALAMEQTALCAERTHNSTAQSVAPAENIAPAEKIAPAENSGTGTQPAEPAGVRLEPSAELSTAASSSPAPRAVKGIEQVREVIAALPPELAEPMSDFLDVKPGTKKFAKRLKQMEEILSLPPELRAESGINDMFRQGILKEYPELIGSCLETARNKIGDAREAQMKADQQARLLARQEQLAQRFMQEHPHQPAGDTLYEFLNNPHLDRRIGEGKTTVDPFVAARLVAQNSGPGQCLEVLNGNRPLGMIASGGESIVLLMENPIGNTQHRVLKITFTEFQPEYGHRKYPNGAAIDTKAYRLTEEPLGDARGRAMFYTQEYLETENIDPSKMDQFEHDLRNSGYFWTDHEVAHIRQVGVDCNGNVVLADYGAVSVQQAPHF